MSSIPFGSRAALTGGMCRLVFVSVAVLAAYGLSGCKNTNFLSTKQEVGIGRDAAKEVERQYKVDEKGSDAARVRRIGERLVLHAADRPGVPYSFKVLETKDVNAVSLPGGPIYVFRGLLDMVGDDDDALASVIGHEMGHINARHAAKLISQQMAAEVGIGVLLQGRTAGDVGRLAENLLSLHYGREDEYEADRRGLSYAQKAGYDPRGMVRFFRKLQTLEQRGGEPEFVRSHPLTTSRIGRAERIIEARDYPYGH